MSLAQIELEPVGLNSDADNDDTVPYDRNELRERLDEQFCHEPAWPPRRGFRFWLADKLDAIGVWCWSLSESLRAVKPRGGC